MDVKVTNEIQQRFVAAGYVITPTDRLVVEDESGNVIAAKRFSLNYNPKESGADEMSDEFMELMDRVVRLTAEDVPPEAYQMVRHIVKVVEDDHVSIHFYFLLKTASL
jgi:hypothetical protein